MVASQLIKVLVVCGNGINCEQESSYAFRLAGFSVDTIFFNNLIRHPKLLQAYQVIVIPGGFSYGDDTGAGNAMSAVIKCFLKDEMDECLKRGGVLVGICNGCQVMTNVGVVPGSGRVALDVNASGHYECRWVYARAPKSSLWFDKDDIVRMPVAHKEGNFVIPAGADIDDVILLRYCDMYGNYANGQYPINPNGSFMDIAAITNSAGNACGIMPHPERAIRAEQFPASENFKDNIGFFSRVAQAFI